MKELKKERINLDKFFLNKKKEKSKSSKNYILNE